MAKRGRKSQAELTAVAALPVVPQRPEPPKSIGSDGCARWREITSVLPADYWRPSDLLMLADMIRSEQFVRECDALIEKHGHIVTGATGALVTNPAVTARKGYLATIITFQRALRLCPSTRLDKTSAKLRTAPAKRPWESQK